MADVARGAPDRGVQEWGMADVARGAPDRGVQESGMADVARCAPDRGVQEWGMADVARGALWCEHYDERVLHLWDLSGLDTGDPLPHQSH